jgi:hypothetical protein
VVVLQIVGLVGMGADEEEQYALALLSAVFERPQSSQ